MDEPGAASYDIEGAHSVANTFRGKMTVDKAKIVRLYDRQAKIGTDRPDPRKHHYSMDILSKITPTSIATSRRRL